MSGSRFGVEAGSERTSATTVVLVPNGPPWSQRQRNSGKPKDQSKNCKISKLLALKTKILKLLALKTHKKWKKS